jgi:hypothetical protein
MGWNRPKYRNIRSSGFASKLERAVYNLYELQQKAGEISDLRCQAKVYLTEARILYIADFAFIRAGVRCYGEAKGMATPVWAIKLRLFRHYGDGPLEIWGGSYTTPKITELVIPNCL